MARVKYDVPMVEQGRSPVCWFACAAMLIQFKQRRTVTAEGLNMAPGEDFREGSVPSFGVRQYAQMRSMGLINARSDQLPGWGGTVDEQLLFKQLKRHGPFILHHRCGAFWYGPSRSIPVGTHSVLVTGIDTDQDGVWFNNPWGERDVATTTASIIGAITQWETNPANVSMTWC